MFKYFTLIARYGKIAFKVMITTLEVTLIYVFSLNFQIIRLFLTIFKFISECGLRKSKKNKPLLFVKAKATLKIKQRARRIN